MAADITLINLNMLYVRYYDSVEKELHVPLGTLYLTRILEQAGYEVDFRDYQLNTYDDPFDAENICDYLADSAELVGVSVMANLLPFALVALRTFKERNPDKTVVLGGVGPKSVERADPRALPLDRRHRLRRRGADDRPAGGAPPNRARVRRGAQHDLAW